MLKRNDTELNKPRFVFVLTSSSLEVSCSDRRGVKKRHLVTSDDHYICSSKLGKTLTEYRPDITHRCLLTLLDSPLNKEGHLQVYIHTNKNVLIWINPETRIPRTFARFSGVMAQLLTSFSIKSESAKEPLLKIVKNPIENYIPADSIKIGLSKDADLQKTSEFVRTLDRNKAVVFFVGAMSHGADNFGCATTNVSISKHSLSASTVCGKICYALEDLLNIS